MLTAFFMKKIIFAVFISFIFIAAACNRDFDCFSQKTDKKSLSFSTEEYINFHFSNVFNVIVYQDSSQKVIIEGPDYLVSKTVLKKNNDHIEFIIKDPCNFLKDQKQLITVSLFVPEIDTLQFNTLSYLSIPDTFTTNLLVLHYWGKTGSCETLTNTDKLFLYTACLTGDYKFKGKTRRFTAELRKASSFDAEGLDTRFGVVYHYSRNDCRINASERLLVRIHNTGNVYIDSLPSNTDIQRFGEGQVITKEQ
jgi:hypothetical protein